MWTNLLLGQRSKLVLKVIARDPLSIMVQNHNRAHRRRVRAHHHGPSLLPALELSPHSARASSFDDDHLAMP